MQVLAIVPVLTCGAVGVFWIVWVLRFDGFFVVEGGLIWLVGLVAGNVGVIQLLIPYPSILKDGSPWPVVKTCEKPARNH